MAMLNNQRVCEWWQRQGPLGVGGIGGLEAIYVGIIGRTGQVGGWAAAVILVLLWSYPLVCRYFTMKTVMIYHEATTQWDAKSAVKFFCCTNCLLHLATFWRLQASCSYTNNTAADRYPVGRSLLVAVLAVQDEHSGISAVCFNLHYDIIISCYVHASAQKSLTGSCLIYHWNPVFV